MRSERKRMERGKGRERRGARRERQEGEEDLGKKER